MDITVLGSGQDGGVPQLFCACPNCTAARSDPVGERTASSVRIDDHGRSWLLDASPDLRRQWQGPAPHGIVLTHAHMGHVAGLRLLGKEGPDRSPPIWCTPSMAGHLRSEGLGDDIREVEPGDGWDDGLSFHFHPIDHRAEHTDTVAIEVTDGRRRLVFLPDTDAWDGACERATAALGEGDLLLVDGTFHGDDELPGRDLRSIPHPFIAETLPVMAALAARGVQVVYTHLNHSNPCCDPASPEAAAVRAAGVDIAHDGLRL